MRNYLKWLAIFTLMAALLAVGGTGCSDEGAGDAEPYKVGAVFALTGPASNLGVPEEQTIEMMVEQINDAGGVNGHPLEVIIYDTETNAEKCATLVNRLIEQDQVLAIIGPTTSGNSMAIIETVTSAKIPLISCAASIDIVTPVEERYWVFKTPQTEVQAITEIYTHLQAEGISKVALITDTSGFGAAGRKYLMSDAGDYGLTAVSIALSNRVSTPLTNSSLRGNSTQRHPSSNSAKATRSGNRPNNCRAANA